jgi:cyanophycinase
VFPEQSQPFPLAFCAAGVEDGREGNVSIPPGDPVEVVAMFRPRPGAGFRPVVVLTLLLLGGLAATLCGQEKPAERIRPSGIDGTLMLCGGEKVPKAVRQRFVELAGGDKAELTLLLCQTHTGEADEEKILANWSVGKNLHVITLPVGSPRTVEDKTLEGLDKATGIWIDGDTVEKFAELFAGTKVEKALRAAQQRGAVIGAVASAGVTRLLAGSDTPKLTAGLDLLPGTVVDPQFTADRKQRSLDVLAKNPGLLGIGLDEGTALIVHGRELRVAGEGTATLCLAKGPTREARTVELKGRGVADLTALRRAAVARAEPAFPPKEAAVPEVNGGSLVIVGGGGMPADVIKKFIDLAGGPDAPFVVLPTANPDPLPTEPAVGFLEKAGCKNVKVLKGRELKDVESAEYVEALKKAKGIWFGGGRQWRFVDAYEGTKAHDAMREALRQGAVIGGSSAGATIQGDYLCRGSPFGNEEIAYEGYERGLGFLPGVAIDQHFTQRKRFDDMTSLMKTYPQLLGVGLDEATALVVQGHVAEVMGKGHAHFYDRTRPAEEGKPDYEALKAGDRYDLKACKVLPADAPKPKDGDGKP